MTVTPTQTKRHYLSDAIFLVGLESQDVPFLRQLEEALGHPVFSLFLGRRSCPPTMPLCLGIRETGLEDSLEGEPALAPSWRRSGSAPKRILLDADSGEPGAVAQRDLPLSFSPDPPAIWLPGCQGTQGPRNSAHRARSLFGIVR